MYMRLGFAVAIHVDPDVLLIDEVLAVGDEAFTRKCLDKIAEFRRRGKTIVFVTHSLGLVDKMCDDVLWLSHGRTRGRGEPKRVVDEYLTYVAGGEEALLAREHGQGAGDAGPEAAMPAPEGAGGYRQGRWGGREIEIAGVRLLDDRGRERHVYVPGERLTIALEIAAREPVSDFVFGVGIYSADGVNCYGTNTHLEEFLPQEVRGDGEVTFRIDSLDLVENTYKLDVAVHKRDGYPYDYHRLLYTFRVKSRTKEVGIYRPKHTWTFSPNISLTRDEPQ